MPEKISEKFLKQKFVTIKSFKNVDEQVMSTSEQVLQQL